MRAYLNKIIMAAKKKVVTATPTTKVAEIINKPFVKGPHHIVKDGEVILDPNFVNPGVFSSNA